MIDIDAPGTSQDVQARYDLEVPVLALDGGELALGLPTALG